MSETSVPSTKDQDPAKEMEDPDGNSPPETDSEFRLTIRKLDLPVRPRGVLAE
jgi:hypothetical protein